MNGAGLSPWRCSKCGQPKFGFVRHTCTPRAVRYWQALQAAWAMVVRLYNRDPWPVSTPLIRQPSCSRQARRVERVRAMSKRKEGAAL